MAAWQTSWRDSREQSCRRFAMLTLAVIFFTALSTATTRAQGYASASLDERANRTCRSIIALINPPKMSLGVTSTMRIGEANAISIAYVARPEEGVSRNRRIVCAFQDRGTGAQRIRKLIAVIADGVPVGPARLYLMQRYWVGSPEADAAATMLAPSARR